MAKPLVSMRVEGLKPLLRKLKRLPARAQRTILRKAVKKAATPVAKAARRNAPVGTGINPDGTERPPLKKTITSTRAKIGKSGTVYVVTGPRAKAAPHARLVHDGTKPHDITLTRPLVLGNTVLPAGFTIHHPGAAPQPFLADAVESQAANVQRIMAKEIGAGLEREAAKGAA